MLVARRSASPLLTAALLCLSASVQAERYTIPWFEPPGAGSDPQSVLRIVNAEADAATVTIHAIDDAGVRTGTAVLSLNGSAAVDISAMELQIGDATKGLSSGVGNFSAGVRLAIESDVPIVPLALVRAGDGTLSALHDTVLPAAVPGTAGYRYDVPIFHPGSNVTQPSRLRLINPNDTGAQVAINAWDDTGAAASGGTVQLTLPPGGAQTFTSQQLEAGDAEAFLDRLGAGVGNWRLSVSADRPIQVVNVAVGAATGYWSNLSTTAVDGWAPQDAASFEARFLGRTTVSRDGQDRTTFQVLANNGFLHTYIDEGVEIRQEGRYRYERTGRDAGILRLDYDIDVNCEARFYFGSRYSGWYAFACVDREDRVEVWTGNTWLSLDAGAMPLDLGSGLDDRVYTSGTAIDTLTLPAATGGDGEYTYSLSPEVPGLRFDPATLELTGTPSEAGVYLMTYRVRDASGDTDWRYFNIAVETAAGGGETTHGVGDTLSDLPTGSWTPDVTSGGSFLLSGGDATVRLDEDGYIEEGEYRFTCQSPGGCVIENRSVTSGSVVQTAKGTVPGAGSGGVADDHGDERASATVVEAGSDTEGMLESDDVDYFRVVVSTPGTLEVYTGGGIDTVGRLEDIDGTVLDTNDDGGAGTNFRISEDVSAGTYFVWVAGYSSRVTGDYTLHVRFAESDTGTTPPGGEQETNHGVGDTLSDLPSGFWTPDVLAGGATFSSSGGNVTLRFSDGGYIEEGDYRYTCQSTGGCRVENGRVTSGTLVQTAKGTEPGGGGPGTGAQPSFATGSNPGDQSYTIDTAIDPLTLPEAEGGDGPLTYSLSPTVPGLSFNATTRRLTGMPSVAGTHDMTYRVQDADGDADELRFIITVEPAGGAGSSMVGNFEIQPGHQNSRGFAYANDRFYFLRWQTNKVYAYTKTGQHDPDNDFDVPSVNLFDRFAYVNGRFYIFRILGDSDKIFAYTETGQRDASNDLLLPDGVDSPQGIAFADGRLYVVTRQGGRVYAYTASGVRDAAADFNLDDENRSPRGIVHANGRFYVLNEFPGRVYAYTSSGDRDATADFALACDNSSAAGIALSAVGIAYAYGAFHVFNWIDGKLYSYTGENSDLSLCFPVGSSPGDQSYTIGTAISALTLPAARGGDGGLTYSLSPEVPGLIFNATATVRQLTGTPTTAGTYDMTYRVRDTDGNTDSLTFTITVSDPASEPDLAVTSVSVSDSNPTAGTSFTLRATVRNRGDGESGSTTLRYYRSSNATISRSDTQVGTDSVSGLSASGTSAESVSLTAPSSAGTYYYGACVDSVAGESDTDNNCSAGVRVSVSSGETGGGGDGCVEVNDVVELGEGESCTITQALVDKYSLNRVSVSAGDTASCSGGRVRLSFFNAASIHLNGLTIRCR